MVRLVLMVAASVLLAEVAHGQPVAPGHEGPLAKLLPPVHGREVCYERVYDAAHLREHPAQKVEALLFRLRYHRHTPDKANPDGQRNYYFDLGARLKGRERLLKAAGECVPGDRARISCGVDCDGGGILVRPAPDQGRLTVSFDKLISRIRMSENCDGSEEDGVDLTPGQDDKEFRLGKVNAATCKMLR